MFREVLRRLCHDLGNVEVIAMPASGVEASALLAQHSPDLVILDLGLPGIDGFSLIKQCQKSPAGPRILVVTANSDDYTLFRLSRAEVDGVVDKRTDDLPVLRSAVETVVRGRSYFTARYGEAARKREQLERESGHHLTERERAVLVLAGLGLSNVEIGVRLGISADTAERHRNTLFKKLDVRRTPKLMEIAIRGGFTQIPPGGDGPPVFP